MLARLARVVEQVVRLARRPPLQHLRRQVARFGTHLDAYPAGRRTSAEAVVAFALDDAAAAAAVAVAVAAAATEGSFEERAEKVAVDHGPKPHDDVIEIRHVSSEVEEGRAAVACQRRAPPLRPLFALAAAQPRPALALAVAAVAAVAAGAASASFGDGCAHPARTAVPGLALLEVSAAAPLS
jgi:hypothetical protein